MADPSNPITQPTEPKEEELEASVDTDIKQDPATQADSKTLDGANDPNPSDDIDGVPEVVEPRILTKKDATLREFLNRMDDHAPIVRALEALYPFVPHGTNIRSYSPRYQR